MKMNLIILAFLWMKRQFSQSKSKQKHYLLNQHVAVAWPITQQCCFCCSFSTKKFLLLANFAKKDFLGTSLFSVTIIPVLHYRVPTKIFMLEVCLPSKGTACFGWGTAHVFYGESLTLLTLYFIAKKFPYSFPGQHLSRYIFW